MHINMGTFVYRLINQFLNIFYKVLLKEIQIDNNPSNTMFDRFTDFIFSEI